MALHRIESLSILGYKLLPMCSFYSEKLSQVDQRFQYCSSNKTGKDSNYGIAVVKYPQRAIQGRSTNRKIVIHAEQNYYRASSPLPCHRLSSFAVTAITSSFYDPRRKLSLSHSRVAFARPHW